MDLWLLIAHGTLYSVTFGGLLDFSIILMLIITAGGNLVEFLRASGTYNRTYKVILSVFNTKDESCYKAFCLLSEKSVCKIIKITEKFRLIKYFT